MNIHGTTLTPNTILLIMAATLFLLGVITFIAGVVILVTRAASGDLKTLAVQTTRLAQKGIAEEMAGLVGNASSLLDAINQLVRTTAGIAVLMILLGLVLMGGASFLALQITRVGL